MIKMRCPCGQLLQVADQAAGRIAVCPKCGAKVNVPAANIQDMAAPPVLQTNNPGPELMDVVPEAELLSDGTYTGQRQPGRSTPAQPWSDDGPRYRREAPKKGKGLLIGLIVGASILGLLLVFAFGMVFYFAIGKATEAKARLDVSNNLKQIVIAAHALHDSEKFFPRHAIYHKTQRGNPFGNPLLSWRVKLLPYLGEAKLYNRFHLNEPWLSAHNIQLLNQMPDVYAHPMDDQASKKGHTYFQAIVRTRNGRNPNGKLVETVFVNSPSKTCSRFQITDGTSNTIMFAEASRPVPWTKPEDIAYDPNGSIPKLGLFQKGFFVALADGSVHNVPHSIDDLTMHRLITSNDGNPVSLPRN